MVNLDARVELVGEVNLFFHIMATNITTQLLHFCWYHSVMQQFRCQILKDKWDSPVWEGFRESRRCSRDTYPETHITEYTKCTKIDLDARIELVGERNLFYFPPGT